MRTLGGRSSTGAGVILRDVRARTVEGLTTAATVWVTAAFGLDCAPAAWRTVAVATALALLLLFAVGWTERLAGAAGARTSEPAVSAP